MAVKDITKEKPEDLKAGRLVETMGTCKYCHNLVAIKADPDATEEEKNSIASSECECKDAQKAADADTAIRVITDKINTRYEGMPEAARKALISALKPIAYGMLEKITVKVDNNTTVKIYRASNGLNCTRVVKDEDNIDEWSV